MQTWREFTKNIKIWVKWLNPNEYPTILLKSVADLEVQNPYSPENNQARKARIDEFLISEEVFVRLLNAGNVMEKALLAIGFGCGPRAGEVMALKRKDIAFDSENRFCSISFIESKTFSRPNVLLSPDLTYYVQDWFEESPKKNVNDFVFLIQNGGYKPLTEKALRDILLRLAVKIGLGKTEKVQGSTGSTYKKYVGKPIAWTMLRRAHATFCLKNFKSSSLAAKRLWGNEASGMVKVYSGLVDAVVRQFDAFFFHDFFQVNGTASVFVFKKNVRVQCPQRVWVLALDSVCQEPANNRHVCNDATVLWLNVW